MSSRSVIMSRVAVLAAHFIFGKQFATAPSEECFVPPGLAITEFTQAIQGSNVNGESWKSLNLVV